MKKELRSGKIKKKSALSGQSKSCWDWCESCHPALAHSTTALHPPSVSTGTPGLYVGLWRRVFLRAGKKEKKIVLSKKIKRVVFSALTAEKKTHKNCGANKHKQACLTLKRGDGFLRPQSTVAHAAFQDLLSCGQRPRSQPPGTLTYTRRPAVRQSRRKRPITRRALPPRHRRLQIESGGGARRLAPKNPVGQWRPACIVHPPMGRLGAATQGSGSRWSYV